MNDPMRLTLDAHPDLYLKGLETRFKTPLGSHPSPSWLQDLLRADAETPIKRSESIRGKTRDLLRHGGFKPTGRGKPASEYLVKAAEQEKLGTINLAVDANNAVSLHSGFPISVLDLDKAIAPIHTAIADAGSSYVFNLSGQEIDLSGLLCVFDAEGPCGNAVKDSQRTKTSGTTQRTLSVIWGCREHIREVDAALSWYRELLDRAGLETLVWETDEG